MGKRGLDRFSDELKYSNGNKRARYNEIFLSNDDAKFWKENALKLKSYVYVKPLEESLAIQAYKEGNTINLADYPEPSSMAVAILSGKKPTTKSILICRKAVREFQFLKYFEKLGWKSDYITEYCRTSHTDINTLMKELKLLYFSLKECNVNVDKIIEQCSKDQRNVKLFFEYLTKYLQSISTRKPVIVLERIDPQLNVSPNVLKRKVQEMVIPDQNKVGKVNIETVDDTDYREIKRPNRRKSCTRIREDSSVNKPFVAPYNFQKEKSSLTKGGKRPGKSLDSVGEAESCTDKEELPIRSKISERSTATDIEDSCYQSSILKPGERNKQMSSRKLTSQGIPDDSNYDAETDSIESTDSLKELETKIDAGIEENVLSKSNGQVSTASSRLRKRATRKKKDIEKNRNLESKREPTSTGKHIIIPTNNVSSTEEETANELRDSSRSDEKMDSNTRKREPYREKVSRKRDGLNKRSTRGTKSIESSNGMADTKCTLFDKEKISENALAVNDTVSDIMHSVVGKDNSTEDCNKNEVNTDKQDLKEIETEDSFILTENDSSIQKLEDSLKQTQVRNDSLQIDTVSFINSEEFNAGNENKDDAESDKDMDSGSRDLVCKLKCGKENKNQTSKDNENEMDQSVDIERDKTTNVLRDFMESVLEERTDTNETNETIGNADVVEVRLSENESPRHASSRKKEESLIKNDTKNKIEINKIPKELKQMELNSDEIPNTSQHNEERKRSHSGQQILEECAASLSNIVSTQKVDMSTNSSIKTDIILKPLTVRLNLLKSYRDEHGEKFEINGKEIFLKTSDHRKADECNESAIKHKEANDLQEKKINFENKETLQHNSESELSHLGHQVLEERAASLSNTVSAQDIDMSTNSSKEADIALKHDTVKLNLLTSCLDGHKKNIELTGKEMVSKAPDRSKADEWTESSNKFKETEDLQENVTNFEINETLQHNEEINSFHLGDQILVGCSDSLSGKSDECTESANKYKETKDLQEKMINLENSETLQNNAESKPSHLRDQILERCSDSLSRISDEFTESTSKYKGMKELREERINLENSETSQNNVETPDLEEQILKECSDSLSGKSDECSESAKLYEEEIKGLQEKIINFEISEPLQHNAESKSLNLGEQILEESTKSYYCTESTNKYKETKDLQEKMVNFENSETIQDKAERKSSYLEDQILKESVASVCSIAISQEVDKSTNSLKEIDIVLKPLTVRLNLLKSYSDDHGKSTETNAREMFLKATDRRKADECIESTNKYQETKDLQEKMINFENNEKTKSNDKRQHGDVEITNELPTSQESQCEKKTIENASYNFNFPLTFQNFSTDSTKNTRDFEAKKELDTNKQNSIMKDSSSKRLETNKRSTIVKKRSFDIESLIAIDEPKEQTNLIGEQQFERNSAELVRYFGTIESTDSLRESTPIEKQVPISQHETHCEEQMTNKLRDSPKKDENKVTGTKKTEPLISSDIAESSRLRNRATRKTKEVERNITSTLNLDSKIEYSTAGKQITIPTNDTCSIDEKLVSESSDTFRNDERIKVGNKKREPLISTDSVESIRLRKRATRNSKDVEKNIMSTLNLESKSEPTPTEKQITIPSNNFCSIEGERLVSESGDPSRKDEIMENCPNEREPLISSDSVENSRLRKRVTRKSKSVEKNSTLTLNIESEPTQAEKQIPMLTNDSYSVEEVLVSKSEDPYKNDEMMDVSTKKREPLVRSNSVESSRLRKRATRKTKDTERNITSTLDLDSKSEPTPTGKNITMSTNDTRSIDEELVSEPCDLSRKDEIMEIDNKKPEPLISTDSAENNRLRKRATRKTKGVEKNITSALNLDPKSEPTSARKQITIPSGDVCSNEEEQLLSESGDLSRKGEKMEISTKKQEPLISSDSGEKSRLRKRATRKTKYVEKNITSILNEESESEPTQAEKQITLHTSDTCSTEEELVSKSEDSHKNNAIMEVGRKKREPLIPSDSVESSRLRKRVTRKTKDVERNITSRLNLDSESGPTIAGKRIEIPTNDSCSIEGELVSESGDSSRKDDTMKVGTKERELLMCTDKAEISRLRKRTTRNSRSVEKNITPALNLEPKSQPTQTGKQITMPSSDSCSIDEELVSESDVSRNDEITAVGTDEREPISSDRVESRRLRKRATRKSKDVEKIFTSTLNQQSKGEPTPGRKQITMLTNDNYSIEEELVSESGDSSRKDEVMDLGTKERELLISSDRAESSGLRKRATRKTKGAEKNTSPLNFESKSKSSPTTKQIARGTNDIGSVEDEKASELEDLSRNDERMEPFSKKREPLVNSDKVYTKRDGLRKRSTKGTKVIESENDNRTVLSLNSDRTRKKPVREKVIESTPDIDVNLGDDISESTKPGESNFEKSTNISSDTKSEINEGCKRRLVVDISVSEETEPERNEGHGIFIEDDSTLQINERKDKQLVYTVSKSQVQSPTEVDKSKSSKRNSNNSNISRKVENGAIINLRKYEEESMKEGESERLTRDKSEVNTQSDECDPIKDLRTQQLEGNSKSLENGLTKTNEIKFLNIRINVRDVAEDLRKPVEENIKQSKESSDNEISQIWCFSTKDTENRSFEDIDSDLFSVDSQMPSSLYLRLESMDLNKITVEKTPCPDFKANGNSISCSYDTFQEADFSWQCYKLQALTAESPRSMGSNPLLSENGDVLQMLKMDEDIESQIFGLNTGDVLQMLRVEDDIETPTSGLNSGLPSLYPIQSTSSQENPKRIF